MCQLCLMAWKGGCQLIACNLRYSSGDVTRRNIFISSGCVECFCALFFLYKCSTYIHIIHVWCALMRPPALALYYC